MTLTVESPHVYTQLGVAISVTGIAQVLLSIREPKWCRRLHRNACIHKSSDTDYLWVIIFAFTRLVITVRRFCIIL